MKTTFARPFLVLSLLTFSVSASAGYNRKMEAFKSLNDLERCAQTYSYDTGVCLEPLQNYLKKHPGERVAAGKLAVRTFQHWAALDFFVADTTKPIDAKVCKEETFHMAMMSALALPEDRPQYKKATQILAKKYCPTELTAAVKKELGNSPGTPFTTTVCKFYGKTFPECAQATTAATTQTPAVEEKLPSVDKNSIRVSDIVKVYSGPEGELMAMTQIEGTDLYLTQFMKVKGAWNNKVVVHKEYRWGDNTDIWTEEQGKKWVTVAQRHGQHIVSIPGQREMNFYYNETESKKMAARDILSQYKKQ